jgi:hypothetical protein
VDLLRGAHGAGAGVDHDFWLVSPLLGRLDARSAVFAAALFIATVACLLKEVGGALLIFGYAVAFLVHRTKFPAAN